MTVIILNMAVVEMIVAVQMVIPHMHNDTSNNGREHEHNCRRNGNY